MSRTSTKSTTLAPTVPAQGTKSARAVPPFRKWFPEETTDLQIILKIQSYRTPWADILFQFISFFHEELFFIPLYILLAWCIDVRLGCFISVAMGGGFVIGNMLKNMWCMPRPSAPVWAYKKLEEWGMPSTHAWQAVSLSTLLCYYYSRDWDLLPANTVSTNKGLSVASWTTSSGGVSVVGRADGWLEALFGGWDKKTDNASGIMSHEQYDSSLWSTVQLLDSSVLFYAAACLWWCAAISVSRLYLGAHYVRDVICGLLCGALFASVYLPLLPQLDALITISHPGLAITIVAVGLPVIYFHPLRDSHLNSKQTYLTSVVNMAVVMGMVICSSISLEYGAGSFPSRAFTYEKVIICGLRLLIGMPMLVVSYFGIKMLLVHLLVPKALRADIPTNYKAAIKTIQYTLLTCMIGTGCPYLFSRLGLC